MSRAAGAEGWAPSFVTDSAAAARAKRTASLSGWSSRQGHGQGAVEHIAGGGGVDGCDRESGNQSRVAGGRNKRTASPQRDDHRADTLGVQRLGGLGRALLIGHRDAGQQFRFALVGREDRHVLQQRVAQAAERERG